MQHQEVQDNGGLEEVGEKRLHVVHADKREDEAAVVEVDGVLVDVQEDVFERSEGDFEAGQLQEAGDPDKQSEEEEGRGGDRERAREEDKV